MKTVCFIIVLITIAGLTEGNSSPYPFNAWRLLGLKIWKPIFWQATTAPPCPAPAPCPAQFPNVDMAIANIIKGKTPEEIRKTLDIKNEEELVCNENEFLEVFGVTVSDPCKTTYQEIKKDKKYRYVVFYIRDNKEIDVERKASREAVYEDFLKDLKKAGPNECRYGLFDFEHAHQYQGTSEGSNKEMLFLMPWCPDTANVEMRTMYASNFAALKKSLYEIQSYIIQATDAAESSIETVETKVRSTDRI